MKYRRGLESVHRGPVKSPNPSDRIAGAGWKQTERLILTIVRQYI